MLRYQKIVLVVSSVLIGIVPIVEDIMQDFISHLTSCGDYHILFTAHAPARFTARALFLLSELYGMPPVFTIGKVQYAL